MVALCHNSVIQVVYTITLSQKLVSNTHHHDNRIDHIKEKKHFTQNSYVKQVFLNSIIHNVYVPSVLAEDK